ncbi:MAG: ABC transporter ATP-binding protein [Bacteroidales bacterium]|nr:ABC transporter ATP-binding protein [Bacteroidales bacterium]
MLEINNITKTYTKNGNSFIALKDVTFRVGKGEFVAIVGPSGSGKSTLLHTIGGLNRPESGQVLYQGRDVYAMDSTQANYYRKKSVGFVFQQFHLLPYLTVYENIKMADGNTANKKYIDDYLEKCSLTLLRNKYPSELSVGEKQRSAFIRAIVSMPDILLADEPTGNLDPENSKILMSLIDDFNKKGGTVLLVSHQSETSKYATRRINLLSGKLLIY